MEAARAEVPEAQEAAARVAQAVDLEAVREDRAADSEAVLEHHHPHAETGEADGADIPEEDAAAFRFSV